MMVTDKQYKEHSIFTELRQYADFYKDLSQSIFSFCSMGTGAIANIDTYVYSSMQGTLESMQAVLEMGRINDAYALLRKFYDSAIINVYSNLYLEDHFSIENFIVEQIHNWIQSKEQLPDYRVMSSYIRNSDKLKPINDLLYADDRYKQLRNRCNDHTHYNFFKHLMLNDNEVYLKNRIQSLDILARDTKNIFILNLAYMFFLKYHYMASTDYRDYLECNMEPPQDSQYWVATFVQEIFDKVISLERPDIVAVIKANSAMQLT